MVRPARALRDHDPTRLLTPSWSPVPAALHTTRSSVGLVAVAATVGALAPAAAADAGPALLVVAGLLGLPHGAVDHLALGWVRGRTGPARPGLADAVIAVSPAAHGSGSSTNLNAQYDDLRALVAEARPAPVRVAFVQFKDDLFAGDLAGRRALIERLRPLVAGLLILDQPPGFDGHGAGNKAAFAEQYGQCLLRFALGGPDHC